MSRPTVIIGAGGQLGTALVTRFGRVGAVVGLSRQDLDVTNGTAVARALASIRPAVIVNASAYTNVDGAEADPTTAFAVNAMALRGLSRAALAADATFVHYSTDFVFDGLAERPYVETDAPNPRGAYAMSKLLGEWFAADAPRHYVLRVESLFGGPLARSSVDKILADLTAGRPVKAFGDRTVSPSFVDDVVRATETLVTSDAPYGLYHCVNSGWTTWVGLAEEVARLIGQSPALIEPVRMADLKLKAARPLFAALSNAKLEAAGARMPTWQDALARYADTARSRAPS